MSEPQTDHVYGQRQGYPRFFKANRSLQAKIGMGEIDAHVVETAQNVMESFAPDVRPILQIHVDKLNVLLNDVAAAPVAAEDFLADIARNVMQLKAIGSMFRHPVIGQLSSVLLQFLDTNHRLDKDAQAIIAAHNQSVHLLLHKQDVDMTVGAALVAELQAACDRYMAKVSAAKL